MRTPSIILLGSLLQKMLKNTLPEEGNTLEIVSQWVAIYNSKWLSVFAASRNGLWGLTKWYAVTCISFGLICPPLPAICFSYFNCIFLLYTQIFIFQNLTIYQPCILLSLACVGILLNQVPSSLVYFPHFLLITVVTLSEDKSVLCCFSGRWLFMKQVLDNNEIISNISLPHFLYFPLLPEYYTFIC